jgi:uncharacterized protein (UPF0261 family)
VGEVDAHINDPRFADAIADTLLAMLADAPDAHAVHRA